MIDYNVVGNNIRRILNKKGLTYKALSTMTGINDTDVRMFINNTKHPTSTQIQDIAYALEIEVSELFKEIKMNEWAVDAERELRERIAKFFVALEYAAENSTEISYMHEEFKKILSIDEDSAMELRKIAYRGD